MNRDLPEEAEAYGASAGAAFASIGGVDAARACEAGKDRAEVTAVLDRLGIDELDPRTDLDTACAAGELCRAVGRVVLPFPIVGVLLRQQGIPLALVPDHAARVDHGDACPEWRAATLDGATVLAKPRGDRLGTRLGPFVTDLGTTERLPATSSTDIDLHLTLSAWVVLGLLERALELAVDHVRERVQFGQPLAKFQTVQFQLADASVAVDGLRELCRFTLWRVGRAGDPARTDALALRWYTLDSAAKVLRTTQQLHGASGLCDEYDISILCRHAQPFLRLPLGFERTTAALVEAVSAHGFATTWR